MKYNLFLQAEAISDSVRYGVLTRSEMTIEAYRSSVKLYGGHSNALETPEELEDDVYS